MHAGAWIFTYGRWRSCQWLVSSAGGPYIRQGLSSFPTVHWPWVPGIDFLWCCTERGRYHTAPAVWCDQEQIPEIPMRWWWIAGLWGPSILTYRNRGDTCTGFIIIQATGVAKTGKQCYGVKSTFTQVRTNTHSFMCTISDLSREPYQCITSLNSSLTGPFTIYRGLAIRARITFRLLMWQDDVWLDKSVSRHSCSATYKRHPHYSSISCRSPLSDPVTLWGQTPYFRIWTKKYDLTWPDLCSNLVINSIGFSKQIMKRLFWVYGTITGNVCMKGKYFLWLNTKLCAAITSSCSCLHVSLCLHCSSFHISSFVWYLYHIFSMSLIFSLGNKHGYYLYCLRGSSLWCHPDHSSEPRLQAPCGGEGLTSFTHQENTPSAQCSFSLSSSRGVTQTNHETKPEV